MVTRIPAAYFSPSFGYFQKVSKHWLMKVYGNDAVVVQNMHLTILVCKYFPLVMEDF